MHGTDRDAVSAPLQSLPDAAMRLRDGSSALATEALRAALRRDPTLETRHGTPELRAFLRDCERHVIQLAQALEEGRPGPLADYVVTIVPVFRRRHVPLEDLGTILLGVLDAASARLTPPETEATARVIEAALAQIERPRHLPGNRRRNPILQLLWKGAGILD